MVEKPEIFSHPIRKLTVEEIERVSGGKRAVIEKASAPKSLSDLDNQGKNFTNHP